jgi:signal transduction histidine kinase
MSRRLQFLRQSFASRICMTLGAKETFRNENWLCYERVLIATYCCLWTQLGEVRLSTNLGTLQGVLRTYLIYSVAILIVLRLQRTADPAFQTITIAVDLFFVATVTLLLGDPGGVYGILWVFIIMSAAYRWGLRETWLVGVACAALIVFELMVFRLWPRYFEAAGRTNLQTDQILSRSTFLIIVTLLLGDLAVRQKRLHAESAIVVRVLSNYKAGVTIDVALEPLFREIATLYVPRKTLMAFRQGNIEEVFSWETEHPLNKRQAVPVRVLLRFTKFEMAAFSCPAHTWYFDRNLRHQKLLAFDAAGQKVDSVTSEDLHACLPATEVSSMMVTSFSLGEELHGRLVLVDTFCGADKKNALKFLYRLVKQVSPILQNIYLLRDASVKIEHEVHARLTRELHDGTLQSLLSAEMQIEVLRRQYPIISTSELEPRMTGLQALIHQEALNLRDLIEKTRPLNFSPKELPDFLAELAAKFRRETGISARLEIRDQNINLHPKICHEILRIVQEGLSNVRKHSGARNVLISLSRSEAGQRKLLIADDGRGFGFRGRVTHGQLDASHRGPSVIKERVRGIGGQLTIDSSPGRWARLEITIPDELNG